MKVTEFRKDELKCEIYETRDEMGKAAACEIGKKLRELLSKKEEINVVFAAAPSQNDVLKYLVGEDVDWTRINAFHMDEYIGLENKFEKTFAYYLKNAVFDKVPFKTVNYIGSGEIDEVCKRYGKLLREHPIDVVCCGIGENAHIAFNDPDVADFEDKEIIKAVKLDEVCRQQQVNDKTFDSLEEVPVYAVTLTVPTMVSAKYVYCIVPTFYKAAAVYNTLYSEIAPNVPATILRRHPNAVMFLDKDSAGMLNF